VLMQQNADHYKQVQGAGRRDGHPLRGRRHHHPDDGR
jgi:hypothetical protein